MAKNNGDPDVTIFFCQRCGKRINKEDAIKQKGLQVGKNCCYKPQTYRDKAIYK